MEKCVRCRVSADVVKLYDAVYEGKLDVICERCAIIENIPVIKKPDDFQLKESEKGIGVYERMRRISGMKDEKKPDVFFREQRLKELEKNPGLESPEKNRPELIEHFHWEITRNRRKKGLSQKQLAGRIGVPVIAIEMLEKGKIPDNAEEIIRRLENFFLMRLIKVSELEVINRMKQRQARDKPVLLDGYGNELESIPEPEVEQIEEDEKQIGTDESGNLDIQKTDISRVTVNDLREFHKKRIEVSKQEQKEEQKRIEERQRLIEARKEELRALKQKESQEIDKVLGGSELLNPEFNDEKKEE